jgi:protein tyrosine/serine phosphatase
MKKALISSVVLFVVGLVFSVAGFGQTSPSKDFAGIKISNFGKMDDHFYRGARPKDKDLQSLKALGIQTIIDLQDDTKPDEKAAAEAAGLRYINIPVVDKAPPTADQIAQFLKVVDDPQTGVFYVHCAGGRHRTGDMGAVYRLNKYGWSFDQAYQEMKNYDFYTSFGHGSQKDFVVDYFGQNEKHRSEVATTLAAATVAASGK